MAIMPVGCIAGVRRMAAMARMATMPVAASMPTTVAMTAVRQPTKCHDAESHGASGE